MDNNEFDFSLDSEQFSLDAILAEYLTEDDENTSERSDIAQKSRNIIIEAIGDTIVSSVDEPSFTPPQPVEESFEDIDEPTRIFEPISDADLLREAAKARTEPISAEPTRPEQEVSDSSSKILDEFFGDSDYESYASADFPNEPAENEDAPKTTHKRVTPKKKTFAETVMEPIIGLLAAAVVRRNSIVEADSADFPETPEMSPKKAARLYASQLKSLVFRSHVALFLCLLLTYITFAFTGFLPLAGALGQSTAVCALVCLIILLSVMLTGLDVLTTGLETLLRGRPGAESLVFISCFFSIIDAVLVASGKLDFGLPLCAISAWSVCLGIFGSRFSCLAMLYSFRVLASAKDEPMVITTEPNIEPGVFGVVKTQIPPDGFIRRSECADLSEIAHTVAAPFILAAAFILALLVSIKHGAGSFIHIFSAMTAAAATFTALVAFPLPFSASARRLHSMGSAIAGYEGCSDIGSAKRFVVLDKDIFPPKTISIKSIQIADKNRTEKIIGYTGSLIAASGSGLAPVFTELMKEHNCVLSKVEDFEPHEGRGIKATINGDNVLVGSSSYMNLMGIRFSQALTEKNAVFTIINGEFCGYFSINYAATKSVKRALNILLRDYGFPTFAVRDFNVDPMMVRQKFQVDTSDFQFPTFAERYRISAIEHDDNLPVAAIVTKHGLGNMVEATDSARRLYKFTRILVLMSLICAAVGMAIVILLCLGDAPSASIASRLLIFMLLTLLPVFVISYSIE